MIATDLRKFFRELFGLFLLFWSILLFLSLFSFDANDPSFNLVKSGPGIVQNKAGLFGAYASGFLNDLFGVASLLWPVVFAALGAAYVFPGYTMRWWRWCGLFLLTLCLMVTATATDFFIGDLSGGGMVGNTLYFNGRRYLSPVGSFLLWFFIFLIGLQLVCNFSWINLCSRLGLILKNSLKEIKNKTSTAKTSQKPENGRDLFEAIKTRLDISGLAEKIRSSTKKIKLPDINMPCISGAQPKEQEAPRDLTLPVPEASEWDSFSPQAYERGDTPESEASLQLPEPAEAAEEQPAEPEPEQPTVAPQEPEVPVTAIYEPEPAKPSPSQESLKLFQDEPATPAPLPSPDLLVPPVPGIAVSHDALREKGHILMSCLKDFDVEGELVRITPGPVVTLYEIRPARGIRVSKIANLSDDLSLALKATTVRIQAPIPGSDTVGVEIPNDVRETVNFREMVESQEFTKGCGPLTMILGKDIAGRPYMADLARMPHLLIAGATGAGKSVCLNAILVSLLYRAQPTDMRLLLIDPKRMEMAAYADLPNLVHPVVTEMDDARNALDWAVHEMQNRNRIIPLLNVRNVAAYNQKLAALGDNLPEELSSLKPLPYIVIVIDELADLMMTAAREVETSIVRLAQLARAAGIHMILATQRPSVDVVTGLIKANFLCRISFQVTSKHDSRTILDQMGAEHLLGRGDMLFKPSGGKLMRLHGPFLSDEEVQKVATHWKSYQAPRYDIDFSQWTPPDAQKGAVGCDATSDALYAEARNFVLEHGKASISLLQRQFNIGFNRAARLMGQFEREGLIGPADGSKPRNVLR